MGGEKLPQGVQKLPNGHYRVRFQKGGTRYNIGTFKTRAEAVAKLGEALWNLPDDGQKFTETPVGKPQFRPGKESLKTKIRRLRKKFSDYLETL